MISFLWMTNKYNLWVWIFVVVVYLNNNTVKINKLRSLLSPALLGCLPMFRLRMLSGSSKSHQVFPRVSWTAEGTVSQDLPRHIRTAHSPVFVSKPQFSSHLPLCYSIWTSPPTPLGVQVHICHLNCRGGNTTSCLLVTATCRFALPSSITSMTSSGLDTNRSVHP